MSIKDYSRYDEYQNVNAEWAERIPNHWEVTNIKRRFEVTLGKMLQEERSGDDEELIQYLKARHIREDGSIQALNLPEMWFDPQEKLTYSISEGDVLVAEGGDVGRAGIWDHDEGPVCYQNSINRLRAKSGYSNKFVYYWLRFLKEQGYIEVLCNSSTISHYTTETVKQTPFVHIPTDEQTVITNFLDQNVGKIDELIQYKKKMIELVQERRQAMLDELWEHKLQKFPTVKLKYAVDLLPGYAFPSDQFSNDSQDVRLLRGVNIKPSGTSWDEVKYWPQEAVDEYNKYLLRPGDLVLGMDRPWISDGMRIARVSESDCPALLVQRVLRIRAKENTVQGYVMTMLNGGRFRQYFEPITTGVSVPHISKKQVGEFQIPFPPKEKQEKILEEWQEYETKHKTVVSDLTESIRALRERRKALITAAVTGQIDVTEEQEVSPEPGE